MRIVSIVLIAWTILVGCSDESTTRPQPESPAESVVSDENTTRPQPAPTSENAVSTKIAFPQFKQPAEAHMQALLQGTLLVEDGCLRVGDATQSHLIIWPSGYVLTTNDIGEIFISNAAGTTIAQVDQSVSLGGGEVRMIDESLLQAPLPDCSGPYWIASP